MKIFVTPLDDKSRVNDMIKLGRTSKFYGNDAALNAVVFLIQKYQVPVEDINRKLMADTIIAPVQTPAVAKIGSKATSE